MPRPPSVHPTDGELEILNVLWQHQGIALGELCTQLRESREVATTTVATMLRVMADKGLVARDGSGRGTTWRAKVTREKTATGMVDKLVDGLFAGSAERLVAHLVESKTLTNGELSELRALLATSPGNNKPTRRAKS